MTQQFARRLTFAISLVCQFSVCLGTEAPDPNQSSRYLDAVREFADNVLKYGRDTYGPKHTPLFVDGLDIHTHEPVKWIAPNGDRWILSNLASQQNLFRTLDGLTTVTGDPKYKQAAMDAIKYAFANLRSPNGLLYWGLVAAYDAQADKVYNPDNFRCLKWNYPYYEFMWEVSPSVTRQLIESFWSAHILDWRNLDMNRYGVFNVDLREPWKYEYEGGPVYFQSIRPDGIAYLGTGSILCCAGAVLYKLSGDGEPLVWCKRLAHRYTETRYPNIGISGQVYNRVKSDRAEFQLGDDLAGHVVLVGACFPAYLGWCNTSVRDTALGYFNVTPGTPFSLTAGCWIWPFLLGETLGADGGDFTQLGLEELTALGKVAYRKKDNSFIPMLIDGTSLEGYVCKKGGLYGLKGSVFKPIRAVPMDFWAYTLAYRTTTGEPFMWEMARYIALGEDLGDIGVSPTDSPELNGGSDCSDPFALLSFLELYKKTLNEVFLRMAKRIGDNILANRFQKGFFVASDKYIYAKFDVFEPFVLLHLDAVTRGKEYSIPRVWPNQSLFTGPYRDREWVTDYGVIYSLTGTPYPPKSMEEAAVTGDIEELRLLISQGADINVLSEDMFKTPLHRAAAVGHSDIIKLLLSKGADVDATSVEGVTALHYAVTNGHKDIVELLLTKGANVNVRNCFDQTPLDIAMSRNQKDIVELLLSKSADINATNSLGDTPLHRAVKPENADKDTIELLIAKGADVNAKNNKGQTPLDVAVSKDIVELLVAKGAGVSTIHAAVRLGDADKTRSFLEKGIDVNAWDENGATPLHLATNKDVVELLIAKGADVNVKNRRGQTPLDMALRHNQKDIVELLLAKGAKISTLRSCPDRRFGKSEYIPRTRH